MSRGSARRWGAVGAILLGLGGAALPRAARGVGEDPGAEVAEAVRSLGPPGMLWGRLSVEEESPVGAVTPLHGVEVTLYPATPSLVAELERIRQSARASGAQYESAVARVQAALATHQARIDGKSPEAAAGGEAGAGVPPESATPPRPAPPKTAFPRWGPLRGRPKDSPRADAPVAPSAPHPWRQATDPGGLFAFDPLPSGDWLVVAIRVSPYGAEKLRGAPRARSSGKDRGFLPRAASPAKEAELWVVRVRVGAAERVGLDLTDRARWLAGPLR